MDRGYVDRVRRALEPPAGCIPKSRSTRATKKLVISERIYPIPWDQSFSTNAPILYPRTFLGEPGDAAREAPKSDRPSGIMPGEDGRKKYQVFSYYEGKCRIREEVVSKFTVSGDTLLPAFATEISNADLSNNVLFAVEETIYLRSVDDASMRFASMLFQLKKFNVREWNVSLDECIGNISNEMYFYDGSSSRHIHVNKVFFSHNNMKSYVSVKHLQGQAQMCKCCLRNNATIRVINDPILPDKKKCVCRRCFDLLLFDEEGKQRYSDVKYEFL